MNDQPTLIKRRASTLGALSSFDLPPSVPLPKSLIDRFPDLIAWEQKNRQRDNQINNLLKQALSAPPTT